MDPRIKIGKCWFLYIDYVILITGYNWDNAIFQLKLAILLVPRTHVMKTSVFMHGVSYNCCLSLLLYGELLVTPGFESFGDKYLLIA